MKAKSVRIGYTLIGAIALMGYSAHAAQNSKPEYVEGEVLVKLRTTEGFVASEAHSLMNDLSDKFDVTVSALETDADYVTIKAEGKTDINALLEAAALNPSVQYAEPNWIYRIVGDVEETAGVPGWPPTGGTTPGKGNKKRDGLQPNDPGFVNNWGLFNFGQRDSKGQTGKDGADIGAPEAWKIATGSKDMLVAVIDTGVDFNHEDLKDNVFTNKKEIAGNGKDDDGNGFIDDVHGYNFDANTPNSMDDNKHGTHCSGTIGAQGNNSVGTAGVNWNVKVLPVKFLSATGSGKLTGAVNAIKYATKMGVKIMSNSWGGGGYSQALFDAIKEAQSKGILFVAAAGNEKNNNDTKATYPAGFKLDNVLAVAASDNRDTLASFSNFGAKTVHLSAPGVNIYSTVPMDKGKYATFSGTSMACPHVSGAAALLWSQNKTFNYKQIKERLMATVDKAPGLASNNIAGGRLNIYNALINKISGIRR